MRKSLKSRSVYKQVPPTNDHFLTFTDRRSVENFNILTSFHINILTSFHNCFYWPMFKPRLKALHRYAVYSLIGNEWNISALKCNESFRFRAEKFRM